MRLFALEVSSRDMILTRCDYDTSIRVITHSYGSNLRVGTANSHHTGQCLGTSEWRDSMRYAHIRTSTQTHAY